VKIQERTGAGRSAAPAQPSVGDRLPTPPRERKPALAALAVLLILVGALGATMLVLQAGDRVEVIQLKSDLAAGESISEDKITSVMVNDDSGADFVPWSQRNSPQMEKLQAKSSLPAGTVIVGQMFAAKSSVQQGKATVGASLKEGQYPVGLKAGDTVAVYRVGSNSGSSDSSSGSSSGTSSGGNSLLVDRAVVSDVKEDSSGDVVSSTSLPVTLTVDASDAAALAQAASLNEVAVVLVPGN
jgi:hypothetical protein